MFCPKCDVWEIQATDNYCSWCQHKFISLDLALEPHSFVQTDLPPPAALTIRNRSSQNEIVVDSVSATEPWVFVDLSRVKLPLKLSPGQRQVIDVEVDPLDLSDDYCSASVVVDSNAGTERVDLEVVPAPEVRITTGEYEIYLDDRDIERTFVSVEITAGTIQVLGVAAEPQNWVRVRPVDALQFPIVLDARERSCLDLKLEIDENDLLNRSDSFPCSYDGTVVLHCTDMQRREPFRVRCWKPPEIWIWEENDPRVEAYAGQRGELTLSVQNKRPGDLAGGDGNATLQIVNVRALEADGSPAEWLQPADPWSGTVTVEGGGLQQFRFTFDTTPAPEEMKGLPAGRYRVTVVLETNLPDPIYTVRFEIEVRSMPVYDGILALDFGTSNTCCAILGRREDRFVLLPIDQHGDHPTTTPTVIQYCDIDVNGEKQVEIGTVVDRKSIEPRVANATVRSPKRRLGFRSEDDKFEVRFYHNSERRERYLAVEVVADYLCRVRAVAEDHGKAVFKRITVTHPARFRLAQLRDLEAAVRSAFGADCEVTMLQEPIAAALDFIVSEQALASDSYILGVFDFGGGTTDLSVLEVANLRQGPFTEIRARLVSSTGQWFGGEDLTRFIFNHALARCRALVHSIMREEAEVLVEPRPSLDASRRLQARANHEALWRWAELTKLLLVRHGDDCTDLPNEPDIFPFLHLHVFTAARGVQTGRFPYAELVPRQADLYAALEDKVTELAASLRSLSAQKSGELDHVLLSGKSSAIPRVREVLEREFPSCAVLLAPEPKECVVSGACILEKFHDAADMFLNIQGTAATTSRIGIESVAPGGSKVFQPWIEAGVPIPEEGLVAVHPMLLNAQKEIRVLENSASENALWMMGKPNPNISELGVFVIASPPPWLPPRAAAPGKVEMKISQNLEYSLAAYVDGHEERLTFVLIGSVAAAVGA